MELFNIEMFDRLTREAYAPAYPVIAAQIVERTGICEGRCMDIGSGCGYLAIALARVTKLQITSLDISPKALQMAEHNIAVEGLSHRIATLQGDVHRLPLPDQSIHLAVSRASITFWLDIVVVLREIRRVLVPGGFAYLGGGFGTSKLRQEVSEWRKQQTADWGELTRLQVQKYTPESLSAAASKAGLDVIATPAEDGLWLVAQRRKEYGGAGCESQPGSVSVIQ